MQNFIYINNVTNLHRLHQLTTHITTSCPTTRGTVTTYYCDVTSSYPKSVHVIQCDVYCYATVLMMLSLLRSFTLSVGLRI